MTTPNAGLEGLVGLSEMATPGEWCAFLQGTTGPVVDDAIHAEPGQCCEGGGDIVCNEPGEGYPSSQIYWDANAKFIVALVNWFRATYQPLPGAEGDARDAACESCGHREPLQPAEYSEALDTLSEFNPGPDEFTNALNTLRLHQPTASTSDDVLQAALEAYQNVFDGMPGSHAKAMQAALASRRELGGVAL
jgi:hypothetical protein